MVEYLEKRQAKWKPDLVVPIASPALAFVAKHSDRLFPNTPILGVAANQRFLPRGEWERNAAYVGQRSTFQALSKTCCKSHPRRKISRSSLVRRRSTKPGEKRYKRQPSHSPAGSSLPTTTIFPLTRCWNGSRPCRQIPAFFFSSCFATWTA